MDEWNLGATRKPSGLDAGLESDTDGRFEFI